MLRYFILAILFSLTIYSSAQTASDKVSMEEKLDKLLRNNQLYHKNREERIKKIKEEASRNVDNKVKLFEKSYELFTIYKKFQSDSALTYIWRCHDLAKLLNNKHDILNTQLDIAWLNSSVGRYIESRDLLQSINRITLPASLLPKYYDTYSSFHSHYAQSNNSIENYHKSEAYRDSMLILIDEYSVEFRLQNAVKTLFLGERDSATIMLNKLLSENQNNLENKAFIAYFLGIIYKQEKKIDLQKYYFMMSACADIELANKDNASLQDLALTYYELGDFNRAFSLIEKAIADANYCNLRFRIVEGTSFYPIINEAYQQRINNQNKKLQINLILISLLSIILIIGLFIIYKQVSKLRKIRTQLSLTNTQLLDLNNKIKNTNSNLSESNHIKEAYIAQFFDMCSTYIEKIDSLRKDLLKKASSKQYQGLTEQLKSTNIVEKEVHELYHNFDSIFLNLYPTFVEDFNKLLKDDEHILPKKNELLNTELRIFALIRLGIDDSVKIASFLRYSLRTVYNYRTKVRNKAAESRADFEDRVKQIAEWKS